MMALVPLEFDKLFRLASLRFSLVVLALLPLLWSFGPGVADLYGFFLVSAYQAPALALLSGMEFLLPLLVAIASAELFGLELSLGTLKAVLLRPVTRAQWLSAKLLVAALYPFGLLLASLIVSLLIAFPLGYGAFVGGTGVGAGGISGAGLVTPQQALLELFSAYSLAALSLVPISLLAVLYTVIFMNAAAGALATMGTLILLQLLAIFPGLERFLLTTQLSAYVQPAGSLLWVITLILVYSALFSLLALLLFERKDF